MALPDYEYETLLAMMNGMRMIDMKRYFNVDYTTIYRRKLRIQKKYLHAVWYLILGNMSKSAYFTDLLVSPVF